MSWKPTSKLREINKAVGEAMSEWQDMQEKPNTKLQDSLKSKKAKTRELIELLSFVAPLPIRDKLKKKQHQSLQITASR